MVIMWLIPWAGTLPFSESPCRLLAVTILVSVILTWKITKSFHWCDPVQAQSCRCLLFEPLWRVIVQPSYYAGHAWEPQKAWEASRHMISPVCGEPGLLAPAWVLAPKKQRQEE